MNGSNGIHERLRELRELLGLTAGEFARKAGVKARTVALWEEEMESPGASDLGRLQKAFNVDLNWLLAADYRPGYAGQVTVRGGRIEDPLLFHNGREPREAVRVVSQYRAMSSDDRSFVHKVFESIAEMPPVLESPAANPDALKRRS